MIGASSPGSVQAELEPEKCGGPHNRSFGESSPSLPNSSPSHCSAATLKGNPIRCLSQTTTKTNQLMMMVLLRTNLLRTVENQSRSPASIAKNDSDDWNMPSELSLLAQ